MAITLVKKQVLFRQDFELNDGPEWQNFAFKIVFILYPTQEKTYHGIIFQTYSFQAKSIMCFEKIADFRL